MGFCFFFIYLTLRLVFSTSTVFRATIGEKENPSGLFLMISIGYVIGSVFSPTIFNKFNEDYNKSFLIFSLGFLLWGISNLFFFTNAATETDPANDDSYSFIPTSSILGNYDLLLMCAIFGGMSLAAV